MIDEIKRLKKGVGEGNAIEVLQMFVFRGISSRAISSHKNWQQSPSVLQGDTSKHKKSPVDLDLGGSLILPGQQPELLELSQREVFDV